MEINELLNLKSNTVLELRHDKLKWLCLLILDHILNVWKSLIDISCNMIQQIHPHENIFHIILELPCGLPYAPVTFPTPCEVGHHSLLLWCQHTPCEVILPQKCGILVKASASCLWICFGITLLLCVISFFFLFWVMTPFTSWNVSSIKKLNS